MLKLGPEFQNATSQEKVKEGTAGRGNACCQSLEARTSALCWMASEKLKGPEGCAEGYVC